MRNKRARPHLLSDHWEGTVHNLKILKQSFASGQYDESMSARNDVSGFESAAFELKNVVGLPRGGIEQRGGLKKLAKTGALDEHIKLVTFKFNTEQKYVIAFFAGHAVVYHEGEQVADVTTPYEAADIRTLDCIQQLDTLIIASANHPPAKLMRKGSHTAWEYGAISFSNAPTYEFTPGTKEAAWSAARGYPACVCFHEGRLYFGGTRELPNTVWGSKTNSPFDFQKTTSLLDDEGVEATLVGSRAVATVRSISSCLGLFFFTTEGPYALTKSAITPKTFLPVRYGAIPCGTVRGVEVEGATLFLSANDGQLKPALNEFIWNDDDSRFETNDLNIRCYNILNAPVDCACRQGNETDAANHVFVINGDGTAAVLNLKRSQSMIGWTLMQTKGKLLSVAVLDADIYFAVWREINGTGGVYLEKIDRSYCLDNSVKITADVKKREWDGLDDYNGQAVNVIADGASLGTMTPAAGKIILEHDAAEIEAGLNFDVSIVPMPPAVEGVNLINERWSLICIRLMLENTMGCRVNGHEIVSPRFGTDVFNPAAMAVTGWKTAYPTGWVDETTQRPVVISTTSDKRITLHALSMDIIC